jgi:Family of unknown function (DUF5941)
MSTLTPTHGTPLQAYRDDGPVSRTLGRLFQGNLPALAPVLVAALVTAVLFASGGGGAHDHALFAPVAALLLTAPASSNPHRGKLDWLVPPAIRAIEYGYLAVLGFSHDVPEPLVYLLIAVLAYHHYDVVYRTRQGLWPPEWIFRAGLGWDGRMLIVAAAGLVGAMPVAYGALALYLGGLFGAESVSTWTPAARDQSGSTVDEEFEGEEA